MKKQISKLDDNVKKTNVGAKELKEQKVQCIADKSEIMRDLATYEYNYSANTNS